VEAGTHLDDEDRAALRNLGVRGMDEAELMARVSKRDPRPPARDGGSGGRANLTGGTLLTRPARR
jgi:hypothetical protein